MFSRTSVFILLMSVIAAAPAQVPNTFTAGQAASAEQVNANFAALVSQIGQLQSQIQELQAAIAGGGALTMASVAGTYDYHTVEHNVQIHGGAGNGTVSLGYSTGNVVLNANGTGTLNQTTDSYRYLSINPVPVSVNARNAADTGPVTYNFNSYTTQLGSDPEEPGSFPITWTLSGNTVTVITGEDETALKVARGGVLLGGHQNGGEDGDELIIAVKR